MEFIRRNPDAVAGLTVAQVISVAAIGVGAALLLRLRRPVAAAA